MLYNLQGALVVLVSILGAVCFLFILQRIWPVDSRRLQNELIGWNVTVIGTIYGVMVGFMLYAVWSDFQTANTTVESEANSLVNVVRSSRGLPAKQRQRVLHLAREYVQVILTKEWAAMNRDQPTQVSHPIVRELWHTLLVTEVNSSLEQTSLDHALSELAKMTDYRRLRQLDIDLRLPGILWLVLIVGAVVTIVSACLFGAADLRAHVLQVLMLALIVRSVLVAIADIDRPFQGSVRVEPTSFEQARTSLNDIP